MIEDQSLFMQDFGVVAQGGTCTLNGAAFDGIFDSNNAAALNFMSGSNPIFACPEASLAGADPRGKTLVINGVNYTVRENKPDGNGWTTLELDKA